MSIYRWAKLDDQSGPDRSIELTGRSPPPVPRSHHATVRVRRGGGLPHRENSLRPNTHGPDHVQSESARRATPGSDRQFKQGAAQIAGLAAAAQTLATGKGEGQSAGAGVSE